jgi:hypothetical protein
MRESAVRTSYSLLSDLPEARLLLETAAERNPELANMLPFSFRSRGESVVVP